MKSQLDKQNKPEDKTLFQSSPSQIDSLTETVRCPVCSSTDYRVVRKARYPSDLNKDKLLKIYHSSSDSSLWDQLVTCKDCELTYLNPRIKESLAYESYSNAEDDRFAAQNEYRIATFKKSLKKVLSHSGKEAKGLRVLDIGSAAGAFLKAAKDLGCDAVGVEPSRWMCEWGKKHYGVDLRPGTLSDQNFEEGSFDVITLWDVLEHLYHPEDELKRCAKLLKKDGVLVVNYPDYGSYARKILSEKWPFFLNVHLLYFTNKSLKKLLAKCGFELVETSPYWQTLSFGYVCERAGQYLPFFNGIKKVSEKVRLSRLPLNYQMGQSLALARRIS